MSLKTEAANFFDFLLPIVDELWGAKFKIEPGNVIGGVDVVGFKNSIGVSSAAKLEIDSMCVWLPFPIEFEDKAAIFEVNNIKEVLPVVRLVKKDCKKNDPKYFSSADWIRFFLTEMSFKCSYESDSIPEESKHNADVNKPPLPDVLSIVKSEKYNHSTIKDFLKGTDPKSGLEILAASIRYAIFGVNKFDRKKFKTKKRSILFFDMPSLLRPIDDTPLGKEVAKSMVITVGLFESKNMAWRISTNISAEEYRFNFKGCDFGLDPFHTPENENIRLTGRLSIGIKISDEGTLIPVPKNKILHLSKSTVQIPFAGNNDPRRLLMGANAQVKAVELCKPETPLVRTELDDASCRPFGVNLKVGYLAWQGLNHEDAWVLSKSAADKLKCVQNKEFFIPISILENDPVVKVKVGDSVVFGQDLIERSFDRVCLDMNDADVEKFNRLISQEKVAATFEGTVTKVQIWNFLSRKTVPYYFEEELQSKSRGIVIIRIEGQKNLEVGDKLANRHGHKGIVGAIIPDDDMPRWGDNPLEALIDPISVLNRSNWGQIFETLNGSLGKEVQVISGLGVNKDDWDKIRPGDCDQNGRYQVGFSKTSCWLKKNILAVAGTQFVMRMPQHASQQISASSPTDDLALRIKEQRFGWLEYLALWAHKNEFCKKNTELKFNRQANKFRRMLFMAGYQFRVYDFSSVSRLEYKAPWIEFDKSTYDLNEWYKNRWIKIDFIKKNGRKTYKKLSEIYSLLNSVGFDQNSYIQIDQNYKDDGVKFVDKVKDYVFKELNSKIKINAFSKKYNLYYDKIKNWCQPFFENDEYKPKTDYEFRPIEYIYVLPIEDRQQYINNRGQLVDHELTACLKIFVKAYLQYVKEKSKIPNFIKLQILAQELMIVAYRLALGNNSQNNKSSVLRKEVMGHTLSPSVRATAVPGGPNLLGIDEVGVPKNLLKVLLNNPGLPDDDLKERIKKTWFWIKRDPVLHRWGLMPVRARIVEGKFIQLPASFLGPMGADFDGDTVAMFENNMIKNTDDYHKLLKKLAFSSIEFGDIDDKEMLYPRKQYLFGIHELIKDKDKFKNFVNCLGLDFEALPFPFASVFDFLKCWMKKAVNFSGEDSSGKFWSILEEHALLALADDPAMGFGLFQIDDLRSSLVIECGAAKKIGKADEELLKNILNGKSLISYSSRGDSSSEKIIDPIADIMVKNKINVGRFGGVLRKLVYNIPQNCISSEIISKAQALTEYITQKVLSVKSGENPPLFKSYSNIIDALISRDPSKKIEDMEEHLKYAHLESAECKEFLASFKKDFGVLDREDWLKWLFDTHKLNNILESSRSITIPLRSDFRSSIWLES